MFFLFCTILVPLNDFVAVRFYVLFLLFTGNKSVCPHLNKAVDANTLRKNFRGNGHLANRECYECKKQNVSSAGEVIH